MRKWNRRGSIALVALMVVAVGACGEEAPDAAETGTTTSQPATTTVAAGAAAVLDESDDLYALAEDFEPGEPGEVIAVQPISGTDLPGTVWRVLYHSESLEGDDIAVSGLLAVPEADAPTGGRPVLSWAHGTTGLADVCAPSLEPDGAGIELARPFLEQGMVVVATDYEGLGTPGLHPYIAGESEGRGTLDIARAARNLGALTGASDQVVLWGHSQGGHAVLFANQIAPTWAPELDIVGTVAGAPPSQLPLISAALQDSPFKHYIAMTAAGWNAAFPDADLDLVITPEAQALLPVMDEGCSEEIADAFADVTYEELVVADPATIEPWATLLVENDPGWVVGESPILIIHGEEDEQIPVVSSQLLLDRMCGLGQVVERRTYPGQSHSGVVEPSFDDMLTWMEDRLAGEPAPTSCPAT
jgi:pimeloyl-ACP methyl ester carboxylesterase